MSRPLDVIALRGLSARAIHGVLPEEHVSPQPFVVDVALWVDSLDAAHRDDIAQTVSYAEVADIVARILNGPALRLIETLAHKIADALFAVERVYGVEVTVHKPEAPIRHSFADVSVTVRAGYCGEGADVVENTPQKHVELPAPSSASIVLALGANVGDAPTTLAAAIEALIDDPRVDVREVSPLFRTKPVLAPGQKSQDDYWNAVVLASTDCAPREVLALAHELESAAKRERLEHWGPRTLDIDLIDYAGMQIHDADLILPHPRAYCRAFVLAPWSVVDPKALLAQDRVVDLLKQAPDRGGIVDAIEGWLNEPETILAESNALLLRQEKKTQDRKTQEKKTEGSASKALNSGSLTPQAPASSSSVCAHSSPEGLAGKSRLDGVPEESRKSLAPSQDCLDLVWRQLWEKWSAPIDAAHTPLSVATAPVEVPAEEANRSYEDADTGADAGVTDEEVHVLTPMPTETEPAVKKPRLPWLPLNGHKEARSSAGTSLPESVTISERCDDSVTLSRPSRTLPTWDFAGSRVRIVDEGATSTAEPEKTTSSAPVRRSIIDPGLPHDALRGPAPDSELTRTGILRKVVVRPSVSGPITVTREQDTR